MKYLIILLLFVSADTIAQFTPREPKNVAIFLYQNVELLDFAGPGEVFSAAGFKTYTVSVDGTRLTSQRFVDIRPEFSIENAPLPDIVVIPGGNSGPSADDPRVLKWVRDLQSHGTEFMSVCTGAFILAKAGLLEGKTATTHWGSIRQLGARYPMTTVLDNTRWVDNGGVLTTAGVSAGIDGALHYVARIKGLDAAKRVARYMEYDKWDEDNGLALARNEYLTRLMQGDKMSDLPPGTRAPYEGEFINEATIIVSRGDYKSAARVVEAGVRLYPLSAELYAILGLVNRNTGKPAPVTEDELVKLVREGRVSDALARFEADKEKFPGWRIYSENGLKSAAYYLLLEKKDYNGAIKVFQLNTREFPNSADAFDSLGEAYIAAGNPEKGIANYRIAASMGYENAKKVLAELEGKN